MIQRIQTVWLLLAALFDAVTFRLPFYIGDWLKDTVAAPVDLNAERTPALMILSIVVGALALINIFSYGNRKAQLRLSYIGALLSIVLLGLYFFEMQSFTKGAIALWCLFVFAIPVFYLLAIRGIKADQKLLKSLDRLR